MADANKFVESSIFDLHKKLRDEHSTNEEIIKLIEENPIAVCVVSKIDDKTYGLPIKLAIIKNRSIEIIKKLFESFKECSLTEDLLLFCLTKNIHLAITDFFITQYHNINSTGKIFFAKKKLLIC